MKQRGHPRHPMRVEYGKRYGLTECQIKGLSLKKIEQLEACPSELARRILLGISGKQAA